MIFVKNCNNITKNIKVFEKCADIYITERKGKKENHIMGMAASQARYIALTARMNDVEYEAQQINQQRLTLSNKMNEVTEAVYNMEVPTPPAKIDFAIENYKGKINGSNVSVRRSNSGTFAAYIETRGSITERTSGTKGEREMKFTKITPQGETKVRYNFPEEFGDVEEKDGEYYYWDDSEQKHIKIEKPDLYKKEYQVFSYENLKNYYVVDGTTVRKITKDDINEDGTLKDNVINNIVTADENGELVYHTKEAASNRVTSHDGKKSGTVSEITKEKRSEAEEQAFQALRHSNPGYSDDELLNYYQLVTFDDESYGFVLRSDFAQNDAAVAIFEIEQNGKYEEMLPSDEFKISFSTTGGIEGITVNGKYTILESSQTFDETKYEEAMASYKYEKTVYDSEQNELNKKTSIYQRQDKQLELKLTRLDTERNALNTELEAVKKIIQDATEKGFKTFSG